MYDPALGEKTSTHEEDEIHNFVRSIPALHHNAFRFSYIRAVSEKIFKNWSMFLSLFAPPQRPQGADVLKFTLYAPPSMS
jgi:hypothetical protein